DPHPPDLRVDYADHHGHAARFHLPLGAVLPALPAGSGTERKAMSNQDSIFGRSLSFPLRVGSDGRLVWSKGEDNIRESIAVVLKTEPDERIALPDFGA